MKAPIFAAALAAAVPPAYAGVSLTIVILGAKETAVRSNGNSHKVGITTSSPVPPFSRWSMSAT